MLEVAVGAVVGHLDLFAHAVEITPELFEGLPWNESEVRRMRGRVDWDPYAVLLDRLGERCESDDAVEGIGTRTDQTGLWMAFLLQTVVAPLHLLQFWDRMIPKIWRAIRVRHLVLADETVELFAELRPGYRGCRTLFVACGPMVAASTRRIGLPPMEIVSSSISDRHGTYVYRLPRSRTEPHRRMKDWDALLERLSMDEPQAQSARERVAATTPSIRSELACDTWGLTTEEARVLELLVQGHTDAEIATAIGVGEQTVDEHVGAMLAKANATNRTMLVYRFWTLETDGVP
jgi:DNA-binding CsgD family transcriptional regulator